MTASIDALQILQTHSVAELVRDEIVRQIKDGELFGGDKLNEAAIAQRFQISRAPVREAFRALVDSGLATFSKNRGVFVREIGEPEARELYELRATLDETAGRILAQRISDEDIKELRDWLVQLDGAAEKAGNSSYFSLNIAFHDRLVELTQNRTLLEFYRRVIDRTHLLRRQGFKTAESRAASKSEHEMIVAALAAREPDRAGTVMRTHVMNGYHRYEIASTGS